MLYNIAIFRDSQFSDGGIVKADARDARRIHLSTLRFSKSNSVSGGKRERKRENVRATERKEDGEERFTTARRSV